MSSNKSKLFFTFAAGAAIGAAIAALFTTEKGKKIRQDLKTGLDEFANDLRDRVNDSKNEHGGQTGGEDFSQPKG